MPWKIPDKAEFTADEIGDLYLILGTLATYASQEEKARVFVIPWTDAAKMHKQRIEYLNRMVIRLRDMLDTKLQLERLGERGRGKLYEK